jgi:hypothetical protein
VSDPVWQIKIIDKNKINKEPNNKQTAQDKGVGSIDLLAVLLYI